MSSPYLPYLPYYPYHPKLSPSTFCFSLFFRTFVVDNPPKMENCLNKLTARGAVALTDEELIAVLVADNQQDDKALVSAKALIEECGTTIELSRIDPSRLRMVAGIGRLRAARLKAAMELGRRVALDDGLASETITSDADVVRIMEPLLASLQHEECWALYLASSGKVLDRVRISQGGVQATVVDCKMVIRRALELLASQIVLVHNHPSGSPEPSSQDRALTERVASAAELFEIRLLDHVVIARGAHYSFRAHNLVK
jgi:DNA repair protein RadC